MLELNHLHDAITRNPSASDSSDSRSSAPLQPTKAKLPPSSLASASPSSLTRTPLAPFKTAGLGSPSSTSSYFGVLLTLVVTYLTREYFTALESPVIDTSHGKVQGFIARSRDGRKYYEYLGIPYAAPPVGHLRFEVSLENLRVKFRSHSWTHGPPPHRFSAFPIVFFALGVALTLSRGERVKDYKQGKSWVVG